MMTTPAPVAPGERSKEHGDGDSGLLQYVTSLEIQISAETDFIPGAHLAS